MSLPYVKQYLIICGKYLLASLQVYFTGGFGFQEILGIDDFVICFDYWASFCGRLKAKYQLCSQCANVPPLAARPLCLPDMVDVTCGILA